MKTKHSSPTPKGALAAARSQRERERKEQQDRIDRERALLNSNKKGPKVLFLPSSPQFAGAAY